MGSDGTLSYVNPWQKAWDKMDADCFINVSVIQSTINSNLDHYNNLLTDLPVPLPVFHLSILNVVARKSA